MPRWILPLALILRSLPATAAQPTEESACSEPAAPTEDADAAAARRAAEALRSEALVRKAEQAVDDATWFRNAMRSIDVAPLAAFARRGESEPWQRFADLRAAFSAADDVEPSEYLIIRDGPSGSRVVTWSIMSEGDGYDGEDYVFAADGHLVQFAQVAIGWGDECGDFRSELVWDFFSDQKIRQSFTLTFGDGSPRDAQHQGCRPVIQSEVQRLLPVATPKWTRWSEVPVASQIRP